MLSRCAGRNWQVSGVGCERRHQHQCCATSAHLLFQPEGGGLFRQTGPTGKAAIDWASRYFDWVLPEPYWQITALELTHKGSSAAGRA